MKLKITKYIKENKDKNKAKIYDKYINRIKELEEKLEKENKSSDDIDIVNLIKREVLKNKELYMKKLPRTKRGRLNTIRK